MPLPRHPAWGSQARPGHSDRAACPSQTRPPRSLPCCAAWDARRAEAGRYPSLGADWRTDVRCQQTGDPTDPTYREWTHKEIWDLITLNGQNADPREVALWVRDPEEIAGGCRRRGTGQAAGCLGGRVALPPTGLSMRVATGQRQLWLAGAAGGPVGHTQACSWLGGLQRCSSGMLLRCLQAWPPLNACTHVQT